ncbi:MAG TPA: Clp protease N-terminal domain-containing protein [Gaiellaceae bacterium]|nr:Clp protease N-terminal domain-containing protein [Gaiellaceae bacterium]
MATLHVRNFPDDLYERLRASAEAENRSISAQAIAVLRTGLSLQDHPRSRVGELLAEGSPFKRRFAQQAKALVVRGQALARERGAGEVAPAHVLLAMLEDPILRPSLERGGVTHESVTAALPPDAEPGRRRPPISAEARRMLENALLATLDA